MRNVRKMDSKSLAELEEELSLDMLKLRRRKGRSVKRP